MKRTDSYRIGMYEKAVPEGKSVQEMLELAKSTGYDFFELSIDRTEARIARVFSDSFKNEVTAAENITGIGIDSICVSALSTYTLGHTDEAISSRAAEILKAAIDFAKDLGIRLVQIPACDMPKGACSDAETHERNIRSIADAVEYASRYSVMLGLENMETEYMDSVRKCMRIVESIDSPYLQLYPDSGNIASAAFLRNESYIDDMNSGRGHYAAFHLKETRPNKYGGLFYGEGHVPFDKIIPAAWRNGARMFVMEYWYTGSEDWYDDLKRARSFADKYIQKEIRDEHIK